MRTPWGCGPCGIWFARATCLCAGGLAVDGVWLMNVWIRESPQHLATYALWHAAGGMCVRRYGVGYWSDTDTRPATCDS